MKDYILRKYGTRHTHTHTEVCDTQFWTSNQHFAKMIFRLLTALQMLLLEIQPEMP